MDRYLTTREVAEILRVTQETLRRWRHEGIGPTYSKPAGRALYRLSDVQSFVESKTVAR